MPRFLLRIPYIKQIVTMIVFLLAILVGELPIALTVAGVKLLVNYLPDCPEVLSLVLQWSVASVVASLCSYLWGLPVIKLHERGDAPSPKPSHDPRMKWAQNHMKKGGPVGFVIASAVGGSIPIAWWYGRRQDPLTRRYTMIAALILGTTASAMWVGLLTAEYWVWGACLLAGIFLIGVGYYLSSGQVRWRRKMLK